MTQPADFAVIGGGIAGASVGAFLAHDADVILLEQEEHPGYHATGRSAALFSGIYGNAPIRALSRASREFLVNPPAGFCESALVKPRGTLFIATAEQRERLEAYARLPDIKPATTQLSVSEAKQYCSVLRDDYVDCALYEPDSLDLEVHELHHGFLRMFRRNGGALHTNAGVTQIERRGGVWHIRAGDQAFAATNLINAAGAWADIIAQMASVAPVGIEPRRRSAVLVEPPANVDIEHWPLVIDIDEQFYIKPDAGLVLISPADETPMAPCDVHPDELDIATGIYRAELAMKLDVTRTKRSWAGLRTFVKDRTPVVGYDPAVEGFFWLAGQGGYGVQTAPGLAQAAASLALRQPLSEELIAHGVVADDIAATRFRAAG